MCDLLRGIKGICSTGAMSEREVGGEGRRRRRHGEAHVTAEHPSSRRADFVASLQHDPASLWSYLLWPRLISFRGASRVCGDDGRLEQLSA